MMSTTSHYRPSKRPSVNQVQYWDNLFEDAIDATWRGDGHREVTVENGYPFPDFYRVTYTIEGIKKSKLFYGETAWSDTERFVYDLGFANVLGRL
jgi:hypothetical protein